MVRIELARHGDEPAMEAYLAARSDTCMLIRSNLRTAGLAWQGEPLQAQYMLAWQGDAVIGVVGHAWNGLMVCQSDVPLDALAIAAARHSGRPVLGFLGPVEQVRAARAALGLEAAPARVDEDETLMSLALDELVVPPALTRGEITVRAAIADDRATIVPWRATYSLETGSTASAEEAEPTAEKWFDNAIASDPPWVAVKDGAPVAMCAFNARVPDCVQVGGVFTPAPLRSRGYARAVVAGALLGARNEGIKRAVLFTPRPDAFAAYRAIGFDVIGEFAIVLLAR